MTHHEHEHEHRPRVDPGEGVGEHPGDGHGRIGEARRGREPVRGSDVASDGVRDRLDPARSDRAEDHDHQSQRGDDLPKDIHEAIFYPPAAVVTIHSRFPPFRSARTRADRPQYF